MYDLNIILKLLCGVQKEERELEKIPLEELNLYSVSLLLQLKQRKVENMSCLLSKEFYQVLTVF